jgi:CubicO group peptidase (beta-lactamase class C family)
MDHEKENKSLTRRSNFLVTWFCLGLAVVLPPQVWAEASPVFSGSGPDAEGYGQAQGYLAGPRGVLVPQVNLVGHYSHFAEKYPSRVVARGGPVSSWRRADQELSLTYEYRGARHDLPDYLSRHPVTGLLIARGDTILFEHYQYACTDQDRFLSQSMAKTLVSMLIGIALDEGAIHSIDDPAAEYVPALAGTEYGKTPIRALLRMASGVAFTEVYDVPEGDLQRLGLLLFTRANPGPAQAVATFNQREVPPDTRFRYASIETEVLGLVLTGAVKMPLAEYLSSRIWRKLGAEADAAWTIDTTGQEVAYCCVNATLRDWARVGMMLANDGAWNAAQIVPRRWVLDATSADSLFQRPGIATGFFGYGNQVWLFPGPRRQFALRGLHGQTIFVDPAAKLVLVQTAVTLKANGEPAGTELRALWAALVAQKGE